MKLTIVSNIVKDKIILENNQINYSLGGPPCYCCLIAKQFGAKVRLVTKFGKDLDENELKRYLDIVTKEVKKGERTPDR